MYKVALGNSHLCRSFQELVVFWYVLCVIKLLFWIARVIHEFYKVPLGVVSLVVRNLAICCSVRQFGKDARVEVWPENVCSAMTNHTISLISNALKSVDAVAGTLHVALVKCRISLKRVE